MTNPTPPPSDMGATPQTDKVSRPWKLFQINGTRYGADVVPADFARQLERELGEAQKERDFYMSAYSASVNACEFMQEEQEELGLRLGQRTTVEGVACLRRQRDQLRQQLAQAQGASQDQQNA